MRNSYEFADNVSTNVSLIFSRKNSFSHDTNNDTEDMGIIKKNMKYEILTNENFYEIEKEITCPICLNYLNNPVMCSSCENIYCKDCINKWKDNNSSCPLRCEDFVIKDVSRILKQILEKITIKCRNGCKFTFLSAFEHKCVIRDSWEVFSQDLHNNKIAYENNINKKNQNLISIENERNRLSKKYVLLYNNYQELLNEFKSNQKLLKDVENNIKTKDKKCKECKVYMDKIETLEEKIKDCNINMEYKEWQSVQKINELQKQLLQQNEQNKTDIVNIESELNEKKEYKHQKNQSLTCNLIKSQIKNCITNKEEKEIIDTNSSNEEVENSYLGIISKKDKFIQLLKNEIRTLKKRLSNYEK